MRRLLVLGCLPALLVSGCAFGNKTTTLTSGGYAAVNERSPRQVATLRLHDGTSRHARHLRLEAGMASWEDPASSRAESLPVERISQVRYPNRARGVLTGGTAGFLFTTLAVYLAENGPQDVRLAFGVSLGLYFGYPIGLLVGGLAGADDIYTLARKP